MTVFHNPLIQKITGFLSEIGIEIVPARLGDQGFLPGIVVEHGRLLVEETKLQYPGDLLHEAGHLAVAPAAVRASLSGEVIIPDVNMDLVEIEATAWAYAAIVHLELEPSVLFHPGGYDGKSDGLIFTFGMEIYPGASNLEDFGMTACGENARRLGIAPYPNMLKWMRD